MVLVSLACFDIKKPSYSIIDRTYEEIGKSLHVSPSTAFRWAQKLIKIGLLTNKTIPGNQGTFLACNYQWLYYYKIPPIIAKIKFVNWYDVTQTLEQINLQISKENITKSEDFIAIVQSVTSGKTGTIFKTPYKEGLYKNSHIDSNWDSNGGDKGKGVNIAQEIKNLHCPLCSPGFGKGELCTKCQADINTVIDK